MYTGTNQTASNTTQQLQQTNALFNSIPNTSRQVQQQQQQTIQINTATTTTTSSSSSSSLISVSAAVAAAATAAVATTALAQTTSNNMLQQESNAGNLQFNSGGGGAVGGAGGGGSGLVSSAIKLGRESSLSLNEQQQRKIEMLESRFAPFSQQKSVSQDFSNLSLPSQDEQKCDAQMSLVEQVCSALSAFIVRSFVRLICF